jgi:hypothetical protein
MWVQLVWASVPSPQGRAALIEQAAVFASPGLPDDSKPRHYARVFLLAGKLVRARGQERSDMCELCAFRLQAI